MTEQNAAAAGTPEQPVTRDPGAQPGTAETVAPEPRTSSLSNSAGTLPAEDADPAGTTATTTATSPTPADAASGPSAAAARVPSAPAAEAPRPASAPPDLVPLGVVPAGVGAAAAPPRRPRRPLFGTILWGVILLAFAAYMLVSTVLPSPVDPTLWLLGGVVAVGVLLMLAGLAASLRRAG